MVAGAEWRNPTASSSRETAFPVSRETAERDGVGDAPSPTPQPPTVHPYLIPTDRPPPTAVPGVADWRFMAASAMAHCILWGPFAHFVRNSYTPEDAQVVTRTRSRRETKRQERAAESAVSRRLSHRVSTTYNDERPRKVTRCATIWFIACCRHGCHSRLCTVSSLLLHSTTTFSHVCEFM